MQENAQFSDSFLYRQNRNVDKNALSNRIAINYGQNEFRKSSKNLNGMNLWFLCRNLFCIVN